MPETSAKTAQVGFGAFYSKHNSLLIRQLALIIVMKSCIIFSHLGMIMPSGVSSFLLACMDTDLEAGDPPPSIETLCKGDTYGKCSCAIFMLYFI